MSAVSIILGINSIRGMYVLYSVPEIPTEQIRTLTEYRSDCDLCAAISTDNCAENKIDLELGNKWSDFENLINKREDFFVFLTLADIFIPALIGAFGPLCENTAFNTIALTSSLSSLPLEIRSLSYVHQPAKTSLAEDFKLNSNEYSNLHSNNTLIHFTQNSAKEVFSSLNHLDEFTEGSFKNSVYILRGLQLGILLAKLLI